MESGTRRRILLYVLLVGGLALPTTPFLLMGLHMALTAAGIYDDQATFPVPNRSETIALRRRPIWHPILGNEFARTLIVSESDKELFRSSIDLDAGGISMVQVYQMDAARLLLVDNDYCTIVDLATRRVTKTNEAVDQEKPRFMGAFDDYARRRVGEASNERHPYRFVPRIERGLQPFDDVPDCFKPKEVTHGIYEVSSYFLDPKYMPATLDRAASKACTWGFGYTRLSENRTVTDRGEIWRWQIQCQCVSVSCR
jgi:hypothetical protein